GRRPDHVAEVPPPGPWPVTGPVVDVQDNPASRGRKRVAHPLGEHEAELRERHPRVVANGKEAPVELHVVHTPCGERVGVLLVMPEAARAGTGAVPRARARVDAEFQAERMNVVDDGLKAFRKQGGAGLELPISRSMAQIPPTI